MVLGKRTRRSNLSHGGKRARRRLFTRRRGRYFRRRGRRSYSVKRRKSPFLFPMKARRVLTFSQGVELAAPASGANTRYVWRANSCYDPDFTGTGAQPRWFDECMAGYQNYRVIYSKIKVTLTSMTTQDATKNSLCWLMTTGTQSISLNLPSAMERERVRYTYIAGANTNRGQRTLTQYWKSGRVEGIKEGLDEHEWSGTATTNPTSQVYFVLGNLGVNSQSGYQIHGTVAIKYYVIFYERKTVNQS